MWWLKGKIYLLQTAQYLVQCINDSIITFWWNCRWQERCWCCVEKHSQMDKTRWKGSLKQIFHRLYLPTLLHTSWKKYLFLIPVFSLSWEPMWYWWIGKKKKSLTAWKLRVLLRGQHCWSFPSRLVFISPTSYQTRTPLTASVLLCY